MTAQRKKVILYGCSLLVAFLLGYVPQYRQSRQCRTDLEARRQEIASLEWRLQLAELRDRIGLVYLEVNRKNYGLAREQASQFFTRAQELTGQATDAQLRAVLEAALQRRDEITAGLAKGEGSARDEIEKLFGSLQQQTTRAQ